MKNKLFLLFTTLFLSTQAQNTAKIPDDINIKTGTFSNGLKYYIKSNSAHRGKLELKLVVKVGSIVEDEDQQGLAHFMEHMCFNGTKNFEKNEIKSYLQTIGVKPGAHINAYTSFDKTVYRLTIPTDKKSEVEKGFQILEDWAFDVTLSDEGIEKERGVIIEEYKTRLNAEGRMKKQYYPKLLYKSKYAERLPIGKKEIIENFKPETLRKFYKDWYRPDLMAVIAVGDVSVEELEKKVKKHFDKPNNSENYRERKYFSDESHQETFISIVSDAEATSNTVNIYYKNPQEQLPENSEASQLKKLKERIFSIMINYRLHELANGNKPPFIKGQAINIKSRVKNKEIYTSTAEVKNSDYLLAIKTLLTENERIKKFGFTKTEFQRAKESIQSKLNKEYSNRRAKSNKHYTSKMINNFLNGTAMPTAGWLNNFNQDALQKIKIEDVAALINEYLRDDNRMVLLKGKEKLVTEKEITDLIFAVENDQTIKAYTDKVADNGIFNEKLEAGTITKEEEDKLHSIKTITLNNGVKVHFKRTRFRNDKISFTCKSKGGTSLLSTKDFFDSHFALQNLSVAGIGGFSQNEMNKLLMGNTAKVYPFIYNIVEGLNGSSSPADLETLFQLIFLNFTELNKDKEAFDVFREKVKSQVDNTLADPNNYFIDEFNKFQYAKDERHVYYPTKEDFDKTNYDLAYKIYQERFANAADFEFVFVGQFDEEKLLAFCKKYLANLPASTEKEMYVERKMNSLAGNYTKVIHKGFEDKSKVQIVYRGDYTYNKEEATAFSVLNEIVQIKMFEKLRKEASGVYTPSVSARFDEWNNSYSLKIRFSCSPENVDKLIALAKQEIEKIVADGPTKTDLNKAKEILLTSRKGLIYSNSFWVKSIVNSKIYNSDIKDITKIEKNINAVSEKDIQSIAQKFLDKGAVVGILLPEK